MKDQKIYSASVSKKIEKLNETIKYNIDTINKLMKEYDSKSKKNDKNNIDIIMKNYNNIIQCAVLAIQEIKNK